MSRARSSRTPQASARPLAGQIAVVAGATRGAGRGIARALGEAARPSMHGTQRPRQSLAL